MISPSCDALSFHGLIPFDLPDQTETNSEVIPCREIDNVYAASFVKHHSHQKPVFDLDRLLRMGQQDFIALSCHSPLEVWFSLLRAGLFELMHQKVPEDVHISIGARYANLPRLPFLGMESGEGLRTITYHLQPALSALSSRRPNPEMTSMIWQQALLRGDLLSAVEEMTGTVMARDN